MEEEFWQSRWRENRTPFHEDRPNEMLVRWYEQLGLQPGDSVFVPLCGKAIDLDWLSARDLRVVGVEFNREAVAEVFARRGLTPKIDSRGKHENGHLEIHVGDFFDLSADILGRVDAIYDRAALVALPPDMRRQYAAHLIDITEQARQLLVSFDYDQTQTEGPPFSVPESEIRTLYAGRYQIERLSRTPITGSLAKRCQGFEEAWLLT